VLCPLLRSESNSEVLSDIRPEDLSEVLSDVLSDVLSEVLSERPLVGELVLDADAPTPMEGREKEFPWFSLSFSHSESLSVVSCGAYISCFSISKFSGLLIEEALALMPPAGLSWSIWDREYTISGAEMMVKCEIRVFRFVMVICYDVMWNVIVALRGQYEG
jgi:hypothetical protein